MKDQIISILSQQLNPDLVKDLVNSYEAVKDSYIKGDHEIALVKSGKFVENVFRILKFILNKQVLAEIKSGDFNKISDDLEKADGSKFSESVRLLIPQIAISIIYKPRSKLGAAHQKPINPDYIDGKLSVGTCGWIMAEFLRLYHTRDTETVEKLIKDVVKEYIPVIQTIGDEKFVNAQVACDDEILIRLFDASNDGLSRKDLGNSMKRHFKPPTITNAIRDLEENRDIHLTKDNNYVISEPARKSIASKIIELTNHNNKESS